MDWFWYCISSRLIWIPIGVVFLWMLIRKYKSSGPVIMCIVGIVLTVVICDQVSSSIIKPLCARLRPSHQPGVEEFLHYVNNKRSGLYGFVSSHAANTFGVCVLLSRIIKRKGVTISLLIFSVLVCYSRIYLGVHYFGDVLCGGILGVAVGYAISNIDPEKLWNSLKSRCSVK